MWESALQSVWAPPVAGLAGGLVLGLAARRGRFCTLGAIEDAVYGQDWTRIRMWAFALGVAIAGVFIFAAAGLVDRDASLYVQVQWNPVSAVLGGLLFGYGMAIAGNCGYGALARLGGGDLRSLVIVVVMGVSAYLVLSGPLAPVRVMLFPTDEGSGSASGYADLISSVTRLPAWVPASAIALAFGVWALSGITLRRRASLILWSGAVGLAIVSGWVATSNIAALSFEIVAIESHSFTAPVGETLLYTMTGSAGGISFSVGSVLGVILGAMIGSLSKGQFRWEACDDPGELGRQILGGAMMGIGGVLALGCSVGQGLTAFSTLAYSAPVVLAAIFVGAVIGLRQLVRGFAPG